MSGDNGSSVAREVKLETILLTYDPAADRMDIGGGFSSLDRALDMLARATRTLDAQFRVQFMERLKAQVADQALVNRIMGRPPAR